MASNTSNVRAEDPRMDFRYVPTNARSGWFQAGHKLSVSLGPQAVQRLASARRGRQPPAVLGRLQHESRTLRRELRPLPAQAHRGLGHAPRPGRRVPRLLRRHDDGGREPDARPVPVLVHAGRRGGVCQGDRGVGPRPPEVPHHQLPAGVNGGPAHRRSRHGKAPSDAEIVSESIRSLADGVYMHRCSATRRASTTTGRWATG